MTETLNDGELRLPEWGRCFSPSFYIPYFIYLVICFILGNFVKKNFWKNYTDFKKYRLNNLSISLFHAAVTGIFVLIFTLFHPHEMFYQAIHWHENWANQILFFSVAYFTYDLINIIINEQNKYTLELFIHHTGTIFVFSCAIFSGKFQLYAYWALLMEVSSIFLHIRTISMISGYAKTNIKCHKKIQIINIITCLFFRFGVQFWQISYIYFQRNVIHSFYFGVGFYGGLLFLMFNFALMFRILASDGFLCEKAIYFASLNRDDQNEHKSD